MSGGFPGRLAVVRVQVAPGQYLASLPVRVDRAQDYVVELHAAIAAAGDSPQLLSFDTGTDLDCWFRARDVITVDAVPTEDPGV